MFTAIFFAAGFVTSILTRLYKDPGALILSVFFWMFFVLAARAERETRDVWVYGISLALMFFGGFALEPWPVPQNICLFLGLAIGVLTLLGTIPKGRAIPKVQTKRK